MEIAFGNPVCYSYRHGNENEMAFDESGRIFNASACGDNCVKWIVELGKRKDLTINLHHVMDFSSEV